MQCIMVDKCDQPSLSSFCANASFYVGPKNKKRNKTNNKNFEMNGDIMEIETFTVHFIFGVLDLDTITQIISMTNFTTTEFHWTAFKVQS